MVEIKFTDQALNDIDEIAYFISASSSYYAGLQVQKFFQRVDMLERFPNIGRVVPELNHKSVRELIEGSYRIIYRVLTKAEIHILTIHHSSKRLRKSRLKRLIKK